VFVGFLGKKAAARQQWFTPVILATQEADIRRMRFEASPGQIIQKTLS
jgi:hypothetical protein